MPACIGDAAHHAVEGIDLAHQMALAEPADGRIAGHGADGRQLMGDQRRARTHARRGGGRLRPRVAAADDDHIEHRAHAISHTGASDRGVCHLPRMLAAPEPVVRRHQGRRISKAGRKSISRLR